MLCDPPPLERKDGRKFRGLVVQEAFLRGLQGLLPFPDRETLIVLVVQEFCKGKAVKRVLVHQTCKGK